MRISALEENTKPVQSFPPDDNSATTTLYNGEATGSATGIDTKDFDEALVVLDLNTIAGAGTLDVTVLESSVSTTDAGANALTGAAFSQKSNGDNGIFVGRIKTKNTKRYLYVKAVPASAASKKFGVSVILGKADKNKISQAKTVEFTYDY